MFFSASPPSPTTVSYKFIAIQFDRRNRNDVTDVMTFVVHDVPFPKIVLSVVGSRREDAPRDQQVTLF